MQDWPDYLMEDVRLPHIAALVSRRPLHRHRNRLLSSKLALMLGTESDWRARRRASSTRVKVIDAPCARGSRLKPLLFVNALDLPLASCYLSRASEGARIREFNPQAGWIQRLG